MRGHTSDQRMKPVQGNRRKGLRLIDWSKADWRLRDIEIAEQLGANPTSVGSMRKKIGAPRPANWHKHRKFDAWRAKWRAWDWSKQDVELAPEVGLSRERVRQIRQLLGSPQSPRYWRPRRRVEELQWAQDNLDKLRGLTAAQVRQKYGLRWHYTRSVLRFLRARKVLRDPRQKHPWEGMNFELPNRDLSRIWRLPTNTACRHRRRRGLGPALWNIIGGLGPLKRRGRLKGYLQALKAEEAKARGYFAGGLGKAEGGIQYPILHRRGAPIA